MITRVRAGVCVAWWITVAACGSSEHRDDGGSGGSSAASAGATARAGAPIDSPSAQFLADYAASVCAMYEPCCESEGLGFDADGCTDWLRKVTAAYFTGEYKPESGEACLAALAEARAADARRCSAVPEFDVATLRDQCRAAFGQAARDGAPLGGSCRLTADCASSGEGEVACSSGSCLLQRRGVEGDGPCDPARANAQGPSLELVRCDAKDDLYCHRTDNVCRPRVGDGDNCPYPGACEEGTLCSGGVCRRLPAPGEPCLNAVAGAGGFCRAGSLCDVASLTCVPGRELGEACSDAPQCQSGVCLDRSCASSDFTKSLNCTGP